MKYFSINGNVHAYEADGSQDAYIPTDAVPMTPEEVEAHLNSAQPQPDPKLTGVDFNGTMCSATADDQNGLAAVLVALQFQGAEFQPTRFHFSNGNTLVISLDNWHDFAAVWLPFRQSFFAVDAE